MISYEFTIQEIVAILMNKFHASNEFVSWIKYKHYPILSWTPEGPYHGKLSQHFNTTSYGKWLIPVKLIHFVNNILRRRYTMLSRGFPSVSINTAQADWTMIDIQQAGKYVPQNYLYTECQHFTSGMQIKDFTLIRKVFYYFAIDSRDTGRTYKRLHWAVSRTDMPSFSDFQKLIFRYLLSQLQISRELF